MLKKILYYLLNDYVYLNIRYYLKLGKFPKLKSPVLFTEKMQWLKLYDRQEFYTMVADKIEVKKYVASKLGEKYVIPVDRVFNNIYEVSLKNFPSYPVIIKTNHDSGGSIVVKDKNEVDFEALRKKIKKKIARKFYYNHREWEYKNIKPKVFLEKLVYNGNGNNLLNDYKVHCFHGVPMFIQTIFDRETMVKEDWYNTKWEPLDMWYFSPNRKNVEKPRRLKEMLKIASILSNEFKYVRIDLYEINESILFGEFTLHPYGGFMKWNNSIWDKKLGDLIHIDNNQAT